MSELTLAEIQLAVDRAHRVLWKTQRKDGSWDTAGEVGPWVTAQVVTALRYLNALNEEDTAGAAKWLTGQQRDDGSFAVHPYATVGDLSSTACAWAALELCHATEAAGKARQWVLTHGGLDAIIAKMAEGDLAAIYLALAKCVDPQRLPCPSTLVLLLPPVRHFLQTRFHSGVLMGAFESELIIKNLRGDYGIDGSRRGFTDRLKASAAIELYRTFQNADGSWNDSTVISVMVLPALAAAGLSTSHPMLATALAWLDKQKVRDATGMHFAGFGTEVWATAFDVRALMAAEVPPGDPDISRALEWLVDAQCTQPMPRVDNRKSDAVLTGGWAFQRTNSTMPDCDDAGVALSALGIAYRWQKQGAVSPALHAKIGASTELGKKWLYSMQNPDGGWSAFVWGLPGKKPGAMMQKNPQVNMSNPLSMVKTVIWPPAALGDPSTEDLTSRVLHGLGQLGESVTNSPRVARAVDFLRAQQAGNGAWWGRWVVNYLSASAFVLLGLKAVQVDMQQPWVQRAVEWVISKQNPDGGFGEGPESYRFESKAGIGPTMLPLTGLVVQALIDAGRGDHPAVKKAVALLVRSQRNDGTWDNGLYLHTNVPPDTFYVYPEAARFYPTEALGRYVQHLGEPTNAVNDRVRWNNALLDGARQKADPLADQVIATIFKDGQVDAVRKLMMGIFATDADLPPQLPDAAKAYFKDTALPDFTDTSKLQLAQSLFTRAGWQVAMGLFCSSLPQAYAASHGAHVITQTQGMTQNHVRQRVFETAQFVFDVMDEGAFGRNGQGVRSAQKVRLMHAAVRYLIQKRPMPVWDVAMFGMPINQEDLAGTLMTFSVVTLDGLKRLGVEVTADEGEAWLHAWKVVGHLLGVDPALIPTDVADGEELMEAIRDRQWARGTDGQKLIVPLVEMMKDYFPGTALDGFPVALIRTLAGDYCADLLGLPAADWSRSLISFASVVDEVFDRADHQSLGSRLLARATHDFMEAIVEAKRDGKDAQFRIPKSLQGTVDPRT